MSLKILDELVIKKLYKKLIKIEDFSVIFFKKSFFLQIFIRKLTKGIDFKQYFKEFYKHCSPTEKRNLW